ncbi:MAG TPA: polyphenol oxidase family protein [Thermoanaerobaculia bacterium]
MIPRSARDHLQVEHSPFGRIVVASNAPLFYTTRDFDGRLNDRVAGEITSFILERFGIDTVLNTCTQVHGVTVAAGEKSKRWRECDSCDALWSAEGGVTLGIKVADCLPVSMLDRANKIAANIHSGWRGAAQNIVGETLDVMERSSAFSALDAEAWLGPSIRVCCFEVGEEVAERFDERFVERAHAKPHVDLPAYTADLLRARGIERIHDSGLCTRCEGSIFHSFRRDGSGGRNLALLAQ